MDDNHTLVAAGYIELNPLKAGMVNRAEEYQWSSAKAHLSGRDNNVVTVSPLVEIEPEGRNYRSTISRTKRIRHIKATSRPTGHVARHHLSSSWKESHPEY
jgi:putative transposase